MFRTTLTACAVGLLALAVPACSLTAPTPTPTPTAATILQRVLADCWGASQLRELDGTRPEHINAFECARPRLLQMTRDFPDAAEPHRLLAWGFYFALRDEDAARAEYERAAELYHRSGQTTEYSEVLTQLANLAFRHDQTRGCALLTEALDADPANARAQQLFRNFACTTTPTPSSSYPPNKFGV